MLLSVCSIFAKSFYVGLSYRVIFKILFSVVFLVVCFIAGYVLNVNILLLLSWYLYCYDADCYCAHLDYLFSIIP